MEVLKMDRAKIARQITDYYRSALDNTMTKFKQYGEGMADLSKKKSAWLSGDGQKFISGWTKTYKKGYDDFLEATGEQYKKFGALFGQHKRPASVDAEKDKKLN